MDEFATQLGIKTEGTMDGDRYIINLKNSDEYSKMYTLLDNSTLVGLDPTSTLVTDKVSELVYLSDEYDVKLLANFVDDSYRIIITKGE